jgi:hypothetical protein
VAPVKSIVPHIGDAVRYLNRLKLPTALKSPGQNAAKARRKDHFFQGYAGFQRPFPDGVDLLGNGDKRIPACVGFQAPIFYVKIVLDLMFIGICHIDASIGL